MILILKNQEEWSERKTAGDIKEGTKAVCLVFHVGYQMIWIANNTVPATMSESFNGNLPNNDFNS